MSRPSDDEVELIAPIDPTGCRRLLEATRFGRLAVVVDGKPVIIVLNHVAHRGDVLFRTSDDATLVGLTAGGAGVDAVYEVDSAFPVGQSGWSVIAAGTLVRETDAARIAAAREEVQAWAHGDRDTVLRLDVHTISGRRVGPL